MYDPTKPDTENVLKLIEKTWNTPYIIVKKGIYASFKRKVTGWEVDHTDGIGTKGYYHWKQKTYKEAVIDALAMNLNDLALVGATPYKLQNHLVLPKEDSHIIHEIMSTIVKECISRKIAITGGETSFHNDISGIDIGITMSGFIKKKINRIIQKGDVLVGIASNGLHSNGFTKVRALFGNKILKEFTTPTRIYSDQVAEIDQHYDIHGMMHITGGAFSKLKPLLSGLDVNITNTHRLKPQKIFFDIYKKGVTDRDMYITFNGGVGFVMAMSPKDAEQVVMRYKDTQVIGEMVAGNGSVIIESAFSKKVIIL